MGQVKCWGDNSYGQLGQGHVNKIGHSGSSMMESVPAIDLGNNQIVVQIAAAGITAGAPGAGSHACARLQNGQVKCWGSNSAGQLGQNHTNSLGDHAGEMGDNLLPIQLGSGRTAVQISAGERHTCALLDNGQAKCWGANDVGQLGIGNYVTMGDGPNEMGDNLPFVTVTVPGRTIVEIKAGAVHTCARLDDGRVCCWGSNYYQQVLSGPYPSGTNSMICMQMLGKSAMQLSLGVDHTCTLFNDGQVMCWGSNTRSQTSPEAYGSDGVYVPYYAPGFGGGWKTPINLGAGRSAVKITTGAYFTCAVLDNGQVKCWGSNWAGEGGQGNTNSPVVTPSNIDLGSGRTAVSITAGYVFACVRLADGNVKCWGGNSAGQLGLGSTDNKGDSANEMGNNLPFVRVNDCQALKCGPDSTCFDPLTDDKTCMCTSGYFYDPVSIRTIRRLSDLNNSTWLERTSCRKADVVFQVSNSAVRFTIGVHPSVNSSLSIGLTNRQVNPLLFGPPFPLADGGAYSGNVSYTFQIQKEGSYMYNGHEFYLIVKTLSGNVTVVDRRFVLPCGCDASTFLDFPPDFPRADDGRPIPGRVVQRQGKMYVSWTDNSICATQFSLHRILVTNTTLEQTLTSFQENSTARVFDLSNQLQGRVQSKELASISVVSDFLLDSTTCFKRFAPIQFLDDMVRFRLPLDVKVFYCMTASNPSLTYTSAYSCVDQVHALFEDEEAEVPTLETSSTPCTNCRRLTESQTTSARSRSARFMWDTFFKVKVLAGKYTSTPVKNIRVEWSVKTAKGVPITLARNSSDFTNVNGEVIVPIMAATGTPNPTLYQNTTLIASVFASKSTGSLEHTFTCEETARDCSQTAPLVIELDHLTDGQVYVFRDMTQVWVSGLVTIGDTGCPLEGAKVCAYRAASLTSANELDCSTTTTEGKYVVTVPIKQMAWLNVVLKDTSGKGTSHSFAAQTQRVSVGTSDIQGINFVDIEKETLYVDVYGGDCRLPLVSKIEVQLEKKRSNCPHFSLPIVTDLNVDIPEPPSVPTAAPTDAPGIPPMGSKRFVRYKLEVPATSFEVSIVQVWGLNGNPNELAGLVDYFSSSRVKGNNQPMDLTFVARANDTFTEHANSLVEFRYDVDPELDLQFFVGRDRIDTENHPGECGHGARLLKLHDSNRNAIVTARVTAFQRFLDMKCRKVSGTIHVQDGLWATADGGPDCSRTCELALELETNTTNNVTGAFSFADRLIRPVPVETLPHWNRYVVQYSSESLGLSDFRYEYHVMLYGDIADPNATEYNVRFLEPILLTVVRDPPGDVSTQTFTNAETTVVIHSTDYKAFRGGSQSVKAGANFKFEGEGCAFGVFCGTTVETQSQIGLTTEQSYAEVAPATFQGSRTVSRKYTWSYSTQSMLNSALRKRTHGSDSDMFLLAAIPMVVLPTIRVLEDQSSPCNGKHDLLYTEYPLEKLQGNISTSRHSVLWLSRQDINERVIPKLEIDHEHNNTRSVQMWKQILQRADNYSFVASNSHKKDFIEAQEEFKKNPPKMDSAAADLEGLVGAASFWTLANSGYRLNSGLTKSGELNREFETVKATTANQPYSLAEQAEFRQGMTAEESKKATNRVYWKRAKKAIANRDAAESKEMSGNAPKTMSGRLSETLGTKLGKLGLFAGIVTAILQMSSLLGYGIYSTNTGPAEGGDTTARFANQTGENRARSQEEIFGGAAIPRFRPLGSSPGGLWDPLDEETHALDFDNDATLIGFSGGGSSIDFEVGDTDDSFTTSYVGGFNGGVKIGNNVDDGLSPGLFSDSSFLIEVTTELTHQLADQKTQETSAKVTLGDSTPGDYFLVQVSRDRRFGTFIFKTIAGQSKCPHEPFTEARDKPHLELQIAPFSVTHPDEPATFLLKIENLAKNDAASYTLNVGHMSLGQVSDARIFANGMLMDKPIIFEDLEPLHSYPVLIQVYRGSESEYKLNFDLRSMCEEELKAKVEDLEVKFAPECAKVAFGGELADGHLTLSADTAQVIYVQVRNLMNGRRLWSDAPNVANISLEFLRYSDQTWIEAESAEDDENQVLDFKSIENPTFRFASQPWNLAPLNLKDNLVRVRVAVTCNPGSYVSRLDPTNANLFNSYSPVAEIRVDRTPPLVYSVYPQLPFPGTDEVVVEFTEPVQCGPPLPFTLSLNFSNLPADMQGLRFDENWGNVLIKCHGSRITFSIPSNIPARKLLNLKFTLSLRNVRDLSGNRAQANIAADSESIDTRLQFATLDLARATFTVQKFVVAGVTSPTVCANGTAVIPLVAALTGLPSTAFTFRGSNLSASSCLADFTVAGADVTWSGVYGGRRLQQDTPIGMDVGHLFDDLVAAEIIHFANGGGIDVARPDASAMRLETKIESLTSKFFGDQSGNSSMCLNTGAIRDELDDLRSEVSDLKSDVRSDVSGLKNDVDGVRNDMALLKASMLELKSLMLALHNESVQSGGAHQLEIAAGGGSRNVGANTAVVIAVAVSCLVLGAVATVGVMRMRQRNSIPKRDLSRATGDFAVVGHAGRNSLQFVAHNENYSPHPVFKPNDV